MNNGWIKLHRKILQNIIWQNDKAFRIWIWCLLKANHQDNEFLLGRQKIQIKRGQFVFGSNKATIELKMSKSTIHYWISFLIVERYIERKVTSKYSIITILNYNRYQEVERQVKQPRNASRTLGVQIKETNKNGIKNVKNEKKKDVAKAPSFFSLIQKYFINAYEKKFNEKPAISFGKEGKIVNSVSGLFKDINKAYKLIDDFLISNKGKEHGYTLAICFSTNTINLWKAGELEKYVSNRLD